MTKKPKSKQQNPSNLTAALLKNGGIALDKKDNSDNLKKQDKKININEIANLANLNKEDKNKAAVLLAKQIVKQNPAIIWLARGIVISALAIIGWTGFAIYQLTTSLPEKPIQTIQTIQQNENQQDSSKILQIPK